jgi:ribonuclease BN (tRNA processing enzyme)
MAAHVSRTRSPAERKGVTRQVTRGHMTPEIIGKMATRANLKTVALSPLSTRADGTDNYAPWAAEVKQYFAG